MKENNIISRKEIKKKLEDYANEKNTLRELQDWKENMIKIDFEPNDWEGDYSFVNEVLMSVIDMSDIDGLSINKTRKIIKLLESNKSTGKLIQDLENLR